MTRRPAGWRISDPAATSRHGPGRLPAALCAAVGYRVAAGSGQGETIACDKIRAGLRHPLFATRISRAHNDTSVPLIGTNPVGPDLASTASPTPVKAGPDAHCLDVPLARDRDGSQAHRVGTARSRAVNSAHPVERREESGKR
ncbi:MAG: hypothetical protein ACJ73S_04460 [Mycobacteriales bacterium]